MAYRLWKEKKVSLDCLNQCFLVKGSSGVRVVELGSNSSWRCSCNPSGTCHHILAVQFSTREKIGRTKFGNVSESMRRNRRSNDGKSGRKKGRPRDKDKEPGEGTTLEDFLAANDCFEDQQLSPKTSKSNVIM